MKVLTGTRAGFLAFSQRRECHIRGWTSTSSDLPTDAFSEDLVEHIRVMGTKVQITFFALAKERWHGTLGLVVTYEGKSL